MVKNLKAGKAIVFRTQFWMFWKTRKAFCIDFNDDEQIIYEGLMGLKTITKSRFLEFAIIISIYDWLDRELTDKEINKIKKIYSDSRGLSIVMKNIDSMINYLFKQAGIAIFINPEGGAIYHGSNKS